MDVVEMHLQERFFEKGEEINDSIPMHAFIQKGDERFILQR